jgi:hypothetical protein
MVAAAYSVYRFGKGGGQCRGYIICTVFQLTMFHSKRSVAIRECNEGSSKCTGRTIFIPVERMETRQSYAQDATQGNNVLHQCKQRFIAVRRSLGRHRVGLLASMHSYSHLIARKGIQTAGPGMLPFLWRYSMR